MGYDGQWHLADAISLNSTDRLISGDLSGITYLAVAGSTHQAGPITGTPEPAALLTVLAAGLLLARRRP